MINTLCISVSTQNSFHVSPGDLTFLSELHLQVVPSSLLADQQASLPECQEIQTNGDAAAEDSPLDADQSDSTDSEMENDGPAADGEVTCVSVGV